MPRLFVAVMPPAEVLDAIAALPRPEGAGVRWTHRDHWHVTLRFLGEAPLADAGKALERVDAPAVEVELGPRVSRLGRDVVCLPAKGLDEVAATVAEATRDIGEPADPRPFKGHLTLARLKHRGACGLAGHAFRATFVADELRLVRSQLTSAGAIHTTELVRELGRRSS